MDAIVLCGGKGSRVREFTRDLIPKILIPVHQRPFIDYLLVYLKKYYIKKVYFAAGFRGIEIERYLRGSDYGMDLKVEIEPEPLLTGGAVINILNKYKDEISDPLLILNGDTLAHPGESTSFSKMYKFFKQKYEKYLEHVVETSFPSVLAFTQRAFQHGMYGNFNVTNLGLIDNITPGPVGRSWLNCGWYIVRKSVLTPWSNKPIFSMEDDLLVDYFKQGNIAYPVMVSWNDFIEIGTAESIEKANTLLSYPRLKKLVTR